MAVIQALNQIVPISLINIGTPPVGPTVKLNIQIPQYAYIQSVFIITKTTLVAASGSPQLSFGTVASITLFTTELPYTDYTAGTVQLEVVNVLMDNSLNLTMTITGGIIASGTINFGVSYFQY